LRLTACAARLVLDEPNKNSWQDDLTGVTLAAVSHDLRRPLASIKAAVTSLLSAEVEWDASTTQEFVITINEQADRLELLLEGLLDLSRIQEGALKAVAKPVSIKQIVEMAIDTLSLERSRVVTDISAQIDAITADEGLLGSAIANVIANGVTWSPAEIPVLVDVRPERETVAIRVIDRGPGVPLQLRTAIFLPFCRFADADGSKEGFGLGLAVARAFVEANGGNLTVEDTPGGGATFVFRLRRC
jgi:two-component system, OmpR family, sensor histidine kinase KdpD